MRKLLQAALIALALGLAWYVLWNMVMAADVARVKGSIAYHYAKLRETSKITSFEADEVFATGFPFRFNVAVKRATLSMVDGDETFAVSIPSLLLTAKDASQGIYRVMLPNTVQALYAKNGSAPEHYVVTMDTVPKLNLSAADAKTSCGPLVGKACADVAADAPLIRVALGLPKTITLHMQMGDKTRDARFEMLPLEVPVYQPIPGDMSRPLQLFVGMLREGLVFNTPGNEVPKAAN